MKNYDLLLKYPMSGSDILMPEELAQLDRDEKVLSMAIPMTYIDGSIRILRLQPPK